MIKRVVIVCCLLGCLFVVGCYDKVSSTYDSYEDVVRDGAFERGWIPEILPKSAYHISEEHDLDTNHISGSFSYLEKDEEKLLSSLSTSEDGKIWKNLSFMVDADKNYVEFESLALNQVEQVYGAN